MIMKVFIMNDLNNKNVKKTPLCTNSLLTLSKVTYGEIHYFLNEILVAVFSFWTFKKLKHKN